MGYYKTGFVTNFIPDNDSATLYIFAENETFDFNYITDLVQNYFGDESTLDQFTIGAEKIQTRCIGFDMYDPDDYDNFIVICRK